MNLSDKVKEYIKENLVEIDIPNHNLEKIFNVSNSKLRKDFKNHEGIPLKKYLKEKKIELARKIFSEDSNITHRELMTQVQWDYGSRAFRNHFKKKNSIDEEFYSPWMDSIFLKNKQKAIEVMLRFLLLNKWAELEDTHIGEKKLILDVTDLPCQTHVLPIDREHIYEITYNIDDGNLNFMMYVQQFGDDNFCIMNHLEGYLALIFNLQSSFKLPLAYKLTDAITNWDNLISNCIELELSFLPYKFYTLRTHLEKGELLSLNEASTLITLSNHILENLKVSFRTDYELFFRKNFKLKLRQIEKLCKALRISHSLKINHYLSVILNANRSFKTIDLLLRLIDYPYLDDLLSNDYSITYSKEKLKEIQKSKSRVGILIDYLSISYSEIEYDEEFNPETVLLSVLQKHRLKTCI